MTEQEAIKLIKSKIVDYRVRKLKETDNIFVFICESVDPEIIPSKLAAAVNKNSGKMAVSVTNQDEAIKAVL